MTSHPALWHPILLCVAHRDLQLWGEARLLFARFFSGERRSCVEERESACSGGVPVFQREALRLSGRGPGQWGQGERPKLVTTHVHTNYLLHTSTQTIYYTHPHKHTRDSRFKHRSDLDSLVLHELKVCSHDGYPGFKIFTKKPLTRAVYDIIFQFYPGTFPLVTFSHKRIRLLKAELLQAVRPRLLPGRNQTYTFRCVLHMVLCVTHGAVCYTWCCVLHVVLCVTRGVYTAWSIDPAAFRKSVCFSLAGSRLRAVVYEPCRRRIKAGVALRCLRAAAARVWLRRQRVDVWPDPGQMRTTRNIWTWPGPDEEHWEHLALLQGSDHTLLWQRLILLLRYITTVFHEYSDIHYYSEKWLQWETLQWHTVLQWDTLQWDTLQWHTVLQWDTLQWHTVLVRHISETHYSETLPRSPPVHSSLSDCLFI